MGVDKEVKVATVDVESGDMATLPASSRSHHSAESAEKNAAAVKEMEIKNVMPKPLERLESKAESKSVWVVNHFKALNVGRIFPVFPAMNF